MWHAGHRNRIKWDMLVIECGVFCHEYQLPWVSTVTCWSWVEVWHAGHWVSTAMTVSSVTCWSLVSSVWQLCHKYQLCVVSIKCVTCFHGYQMCVCVWDRECHWYQMCDMFPWVSNVQHFVVSINIHRSEESPSNNEQLYFLVFELWTIVLQWTTSMNNCASMNFTSE